jgi:hypothetical protein
LKPGFKLNPGLNFRWAHQQVSILLRTWVHLPGIFVHLQCMHDITASAMIPPDRAVSKPNIRLHSLHSGDWSAEPHRRPFGRAAPKSVPTGAASVFAADFLASTTSNQPASYRTDHRRHPPVATAAPTSLLSHRPPETPASGHRRTESSSFNPHRSRVHVAVAFIVSPNGEDPLSTPCRHALHGLPPRRRAHVAPCTKVALGQLSVQK